MHAPTIPAIFWANAKLPAFVISQLLGINSWDFLKPVKLTACFKRNDVPMLIVILVDEINNTPVTKSLKDFKKFPEVIKAAF